jgi:hypothetical protein
MFGMKQVRHGPAENLTRMRSPEQADGCGIDENRAEVPADHNPVGKRLHEIAKQIGVFVEDGSSLDGVYFTLHG